MDRIDKEKRSRVMRAVKSHNTSAEMKVRRLLYAAGYRYRLHRKDLPGTPDIVLPRKRKVIFVHGCFWHQHSNCPRSIRPKDNSDYWNPKLDANVARDAKHVRDLEATGWRVYIVWECQIRDTESLQENLRAFLDSL